VNNDFKMAIKRYPLVALVLKPLYRETLRIKSLPAARREGTRFARYLTDLPPAARRIWYFGVPEHPNLGDQAQKHCLDAWLRKNYPDAEIVGITSLSFNGRTEAILKQLHRLVGPDDIMVMQSGYTMDGLHPDERAHQVIPRHFPKNRVVFFPQTILFRSKSGLRRDVRAINSHQRLLLLARDEISYATAQTTFPRARVELFPDVVTTLIGAYSFPRDRSGVLVCVRNDGEKLYDSEVIEHLVARMQEVERVDVSDTTVDWAGVDFGSQEAWHRIEGVFDDYSRYRLIITDRYHGTIFSLIAGTPVIVLKTADHKVVTGAKWFEAEASDYVHLPDSVDAAAELAVTLLEEEFEYRVSVRFPEQHYGRLASLIAEL
jgi:exopolysaccharide biosynthesis predicted pyruvyltransferase EpsI